MKVNDELLCRKSFVGALAGDLSSSKIVFIQISDLATTNFAWRTASVWSTRSDACYLPFPVMNLRVGENRSRRRPVS